MNADKLLDEISGRKPGILGENGFLRFAVLLPLVDMDGEIHVLFEVRASHLRRQPGEVCFPGGKMDKGDPDEKHCAIRETTEELGIFENDIQKVIPLDYMVSAYGTIIYPFVGIIANTEDMRPNEDEVGEIFTVPLSFFLNTKPDIHTIHYHVKPEDGFPFDLIVGGENYKWQTRQMDEYFYHYDGKVIWGLTARVLLHFIDLIKTK
jgi:8-oxo-dGTP pyrophosphatase MutT (NUDIX family)